LDDLRRRLRGYRVSHVICDNAPFHSSRRVREFLGRWGHRIRLHYLPKYAPQTNPIERVWWRLHETNMLHLPLKGLKEERTRALDQTARRGCLVTGVSRTDGTFSLTTYRAGAGAFPGKYKVIVSKPKGQGASMVEKPEDGNPMTAYANWARQNV
jgi:hypothetical protein